jgi:hypothetical protein
MSAKPVTSAFVNLVLRPLERYHVENGRRLSENREGQTNLSLKLLRDSRRISYSTKLFTPITSAGTGLPASLGILALSHLGS